MLFLKLSFFLLWCATSWSFAFRLDQQNPDYESERVQLRSISERSNDGSRTLHLSAFGRDHVLHLTPSHIFTSDFKIIQFDHDSYGKTQFNRAEERQSVETERNGQLYTVNNGKGAIYIMDEDTLQVEGIIDNELRIMPNDDDYYEDGSLAHTVNKINAADEMNHDDFLIPEQSEKDLEESLPAEDVPAEVNVEVLVVFDYTNSKRLDFDINKIRKYVGIFWSQIQYRYRDTSNPKINVVVSGLVTFKTPESEPFIFKHRYEKERVDKECLSAFKEWLVTEKASLPKHDAALLQLGLDGGRFVNGTWDYTYAGLAWVGTACSPRGDNAGWFEDTARKFNGFIAAAHELGHILNAPHDGERADSKACAGTGFLMDSANKDTFSPCSLEIMRKFVLSDNRKCLRDTPTIQVPLIDVWPVLMIEDLSEQCNIMFKSPEWYYKGVTIHDGYCDKLWCQKKNAAVSGYAGGAYAGTPCGVNKVCLNKQCVDSTIPSLDKQCQQQFGNSYKSASSNDICNLLQCNESETGNKKTTGFPLPGTLCGDKKVCLNGKCLKVTKAWE